MTYEEALSQKAAPDFRWRFDGNVTEDGGHTTTGTYVEGAAVMPLYPSRKSLLCSTTNINPANTALIQGTSSDLRTAVSYSMWVTLDNISGTKGLFEHGGGTNGVHIYAYNSGLYLVMTEGGIVAHILYSGTGKFTANTPHHVLVEWNCGNFQSTIYIDGVKCAFDDFLDLDIGASMAYGSGDITIGNSGDVKDHLGGTGTNYHKGKIQEVVVWSELSSLWTVTQVANIYNAGMTSGSIFPDNWMMSEDDLLTLYTDESYTRKYAFTSSNLLMDKDDCIARLNLTDSYLSTLSANQIVQRSLLVKVSAPVDTPPTDPTGFTSVTLLSRSATISFTDGTDDNGIVSYDCYMENVTAGTGLAWKGNIPFGTTSFEFGDLQPSTQYKFYFQAIDTIGQKSPRAVFITLTTEADAVGLTSFWVVPYFGSTAAIACDRVGSEEWWHNGTGTYPTIGDKVYKLNDLTTAVVGLTNWNKVLVSVPFALYSIQIDGLNTSDVDKGLVMTTTYC